MTPYIFFLVFYACFHAVSTSVVGLMQLLVFQQEKSDAFVTASLGGLCLQLE